MKVQQEVFGVGAKDKEFGNMVAETQAEELALRAETKD